MLGCQSWQSQVADCFCYFWAVFSKRTLLAKSVVWKGAQQTLSLPPAAAEGLEVSQADLSVGFAADFWAWLVDFEGVVHRQISRLKPRPAVSKLQVQHW